MNNTFLQTGHRNTDTCRVYRRCLWRKGERLRIGKVERSKKELTRAHVASDMLRTSKSSLADGTLVVSSHRSSWSVVNDGVVIKDQINSYLVTLPRRHLHTLLDNASPPFLHPYHLSSPFPLPSTPSILSMPLTNLIPHLLISPPPLKRTDHPF